MDIVTILILDEWAWKVVLRTKLVGPIQFFFFCSCIIDLFLFSLSSYFPKTAE